MSQQGETALFVDEVSVSLIFGFLLSHFLLLSAGLGAEQGWGSGSLEAALEVAADSSGSTASISIFGSSGTTASMKYIGSSSTTASISIDSSGSTAL